MPDISEDVVTEVRKFNQEIIIIMQTGFAGQKPPIDTMQRLNIQIIMIKQKEWTS